MTDVNYFEIIKNKLDALVDKIVQKENSDESFRITYAQILEKINTKMDVFSSRSVDEALENLNYEVKNLINEKNDSVIARFEAVKGEFEHLNNVLSNTIKSEEIVEAFQNVHKQLQVFSEEQENQHSAIGAMLSHIENVGTVEQTNAILDRKFDVIKAQNTDLHETLSEQIALSAERNKELLLKISEIYEQSNEFDAKFIDLITNVSAELNGITELGATLANKEDFTLITEKVEDIASELSNTSEVVNCFGNNLTNLVEAIDTQFNVEKFDNIQNNIAQILMNITFLSEGIKALEPELLTEQIKDKTKIELEKTRDDVVKILEQKITEKLSVDELKEIKSYSEKLFYQGTEVLKEEIWNIKDRLVDKEAFNTKIDSAKDEIIDVISEESVASAGERNKIVENISGVKNEIIDAISAESVASSGERNKIVENITGAKDEILDAISAESVASSGDRTRLSENISENISNLKNEIIDVISEESVAAAGERKQISENLMKIKDEIVDILSKEQTSSLLQQEKSEELSAGLSQLKEQLTGVLSTGNETVENKLQTIENALNDVVSTADNNVNSIKNALSQDNEIITANLKSLEEKISQSKNELSDIFFSDGVRTNTQIQAIAESIEALKTELLSAKNTTPDSESGEKSGKIKEILDESLDTIQKKFVSQIIQIADNISFADEAEDIHAHLDEQFDEFKEKISADISEIKDELSSFNGASDTNDRIVQLLETINYSLNQPQEDETLTNLVKEIRILTTGTAGSENENYAYTMPDIESDLSKIRLDLNNISKTLSSAELAEDDDIYTNLSELKKSVEKIENNPINTEISEVKNLFDTLNEDISSISKRTNKLIISSDEVNKTLQGHINEFTKIVGDFEKNTKKFQESNYVINLSNKIDYLTKLCGSILSTDKVLNEAFMYMAEWIDTASDSFNQMKTDLSVINDTIVKSEATEDILSNIDRLAAKIEKQQKNILAVEDKIEEVAAKRTENPETKAMIEFIASQINSVNEKLSDNEKITQKLESLEKQMKKIEKNVNMLAAYVEEDDA